MIGGPFFSLQGGDVAMFEDLRSVEAHLEPIDVLENGLNRLFTADGTILRVATSGGRGGKVAATEAVIGHDPDLLATTLRAYLLSEPKWGWFGRRGRKPVNREAVRDASLPQLVAEFARTQRSYP